MYKFIQQLDGGTWNVVYMSLCFSLLFAADLTLQNAEKLIVSSIHDENNEFKVDGYNLLALLYTTFGISLWLAPSAVSVIGLRSSMFVASLLYTVNIGLFTTEIGWVLYTATAMGGVATGLIWSAEGKYLASNSKTEVVSRNIGIFYTMFCISNMFGNLFVYFQLRGKEYIDKETRHWIIYGLATIGATATVGFIFLRPPQKNTMIIKQSEKSSPILELKKTWNVFKTKEMLMLSITFAYIGMQQAFGSGVYGSSIGFTLKFGNKAKELVPLSAIFGGIGSIITGVWQIYQGQNLRKLRWGRTYIISIGIAAEILSYALIFINIPSMAVFGSTTDKALIESNDYITIFCGFLLGIGDGTFNTQNFALIYLLFPNDSAQSCALFKFMKAVFVAVVFSISPYLNLHYQIGMLIIGSIIGLSAYIYVDVSFVKCQMETKKAEL